MFYYCFSSLPAIENLKTQLIFEFQVLLFGEISPIKERLTILPSSHAKSYRPSCALNVLHWTSISSLVSRRYMSSSKPKVFIWIRVKNVVWQLFQACCTSNFYLVILPNLTLNEWFLDRKRHLKMNPKHHCHFNLTLQRTIICQGRLNLQHIKAIMCSQQHSSIFIPRFHKTIKIMCHVIQEYKSLYAMIHYSWINVHSFFSFCCIMFNCNMNLYLDSKILAHWACKNVNSMYTDSCSYHGPYRFQGES